MKESKWGTITLENNDVYEVTIINDKYVKLKLSDTFSLTYKINNDIKLIVGRKILGDKIIKVIKEEL
jgi:hypothetical protein